MQPCLALHAMCLCWTALWVSRATASTTTTTTVDPYAAVIFPLEGDHRQCTSDEPGWMQFNLTDGVHDRCFVAIPPPDWSRGDGPLPVVFLFHGAGGIAGNCGNIPDDYEFTCASEALRCLLCVCCALEVAEFKLLTTASPERC